VGAPYRDTYAALKARGVAFPAPDANPAALFSYAAPAASAGRAAASAPPIQQQQPQPQPQRVPRQPEEPLPAATARVMGELGSVRARVAEVARMLGAAAAAASGAAPASSSAPPVTTSAPFLDAVDFLAQCAPRLVDLVEAGVSGSMGAAGAGDAEALFEECLTVNDGVARVLEVAEPVVAAVSAGMPPPPVPAAAAASVADLATFNVRATPGAPPQPQPLPAAAAVSGNPLNGSKGSGGGGGGGSSGGSGELDGLFGGGASGGRAAPPVPAPDFDPFHTEAVASALPAAAPSGSVGFTNPLRGNAIGGGVSRDGLASFPPMQAGSGGGGGGGAAAAPGANGGGIARAGTGGGVEHVSSPLADLEAMLK
jgi:hypothetical protein